MKAIITKYLGFTETKSSRIKVSAEGVPHRIYSNSALEKIQSDDPGERRNLHQIAAGLFAEERGWKNKLVSGGTPNPDVWCHCLVPKESQSAPVAVSETPLWEMDAIQFPRLIAEAECVGLFEPGSERWNALRDEMGLESEELAELIDRAVSVWDTRKEIILGGGWTEGALAKLPKINDPAFTEAMGELRDAPEKPAPWKVIAVSSNHGSFGHKGVIVARPSGEALELTLQAYGVTPLPVEGEWLDTLPTSEVQPRKLAPVPKKILDREFKPATASDFLAICGRHGVEVSVARENKAVREAVDGGEASVADIERIFRREF